MATVAISDNSIGAADPKAASIVTTTTIAEDDRPKTRHQLKVNEVLNKDEILTSLNGRFLFINQGDGNIVLYDKQQNNRALWASGSNGSGTRKIIMQPDGNLVMTDVSNNWSRWSSNTGGRGNASSVFIMQDDGNAVILCDGKQIWQTSTKQRSLADESKPLGAGESLGKDEALASLSGRYRLVMQADCNLVLYDKNNGNRVIWSSDSHTSIPNPKLQLGTDGNLVVFDGGHQRWSSNTAGRGDDSSTLRVQDDGNVVLFSKGVQIWQTDTTQRAKTNKINAGESLRKDESLISTNERFKLTMQGDGNLAVYDLREGNRAIWASGTRVYGSRVKATLETDGNLVVFDDGRSKWASNTNGNANAVLTMQDDGSAVIIAGGKQVWTTNSAQRQAPKPAGKQDSLYPGDTLEKDQKLTSANGKYYVTLKDEFFRVCNQEGEQLWSAGQSAGNTAQRMKMRSDGELEIWAWSNYVKWSAGTAGKGNSESFFIIQDDGDFALMTDSKRVWHTNTRREADGSVPKIDRLVVGESLARGQLLTSPNGKFKLIMQNDGNCVLYEGDKPVWATSTSWTAKSLVVRDDDNLVIDGESWSSKTRRRLGGGTAVLILQDDGKLILKADGAIIWSNDSKLIQPSPPQMTALPSGVAQVKRGEYLAINQYLQSPNGQYTATLQPDGNFALRHKSSTFPLWTSNTAPNSAVTKLFMQYDCNLVMLGAGNSAIWASDTTSDFGDATLRLNDDGNLTVSGDVRTWSSNIQFPAFNGTIKELKQGDSLLLGQSLTSANGQYRLTFADNGNLCITKEGQSTYYYNSSGLSDAKYLTFTRRDWYGSASLQIKNSKGEQLWRSNNRESQVGKRNREEQKRWEEGQRWARDHGFKPESGSGSYKVPVYDEPRFTLQDDGNAIIWFENDTVWATAERPKGAKATTTDTLRAGEVLRAGDSLVSKNFEHNCVYQADGNLVVFKNGKSIWNAGTSGSSPNNVSQQSDGNLVMWDASGAIKWQHIGGLSGESVTVMQDDGNLVTYVSGKPVWASR